jgi:hypothetical protein
MYRFTIRDMLWLMVVVGMAAAWWNDRGAWRSKVSELERVNAELSVEAKKQADDAEQAWRIITETVNQRNSD